MTQHELERLTGQINVHLAHLRASARLPALRALLKTAVVLPDGFRTTLAVCFGVKVAGDRDNAYRPAAERKPK